MQGIHFSITPRAIRYGLHSASLSSPRTLQCFIDMLACALCRNFRLYCSTIPPHSHTHFRSPRVRISFILLTAYRRNSDILSTFSSSPAQAYASFKKQAKRYRSELSPFFARSSRVAISRRHGPLLITHCRRSPICSTLGFSAAFYYCYAEAFYLCARWSAGLSLRFFAKFH